MTFNASPLEQFTANNIILINKGFLDLTFTSSSLFCFLTLFSLAGSIFFIIWNSLLFGNYYQLVLELIYNFISNLVDEQLSQKSVGFHSILITIFLYILIANLLGLIPFSFAITAQLVIPLALSFSLFIGVVIIGVNYHGLHFLSFFLPAGVPLGLVPLMVLIELISYIFRPISLGIRLFANMTAGHCLLAVIAGFGVSLISTGTTLMILTIIPLIVIIGIYFLELAVSFLQAYVFSVLIVIYLKDAIYLH